MNNFKEVLILLIFMKNQKKNVKKSKKKKFPHKNFLKMIN